MFVTLRTLLAMGLFTKNDCVGVNESDQLEEGDTAFCKFTNREMWKLNFFDQIGQKEVSCRLCANSGLKCVYKDENSSDRHRVNLHAWKHLTMWCCHICGSCLNTMEAVTLHARRGHDMRPRIYYAFDCHRAVEFADYMRSRHRVTVKTSDKASPFVHVGSSGPLRYDLFSRQYRMIWMKGNKETPLSIQVISSAKEQTQIIHSTNIPNLSVSNGKRIKEDEGPSTSKRVRYLDAVRAMLAAGDNYLDNLNSPDQLHYKHTMDECIDVVRSFDM